MAKKKMTEKDIQDWDSLYMYVKSLLGYDENQSLSTTMVLRLKGLLTNKFMENNNTKDTANYSYETILNTFKYCQPNIQKALRANQFKDEQHKFLYITKIVESNINTVYIKMKNLEKAKEEARDANINMSIYEGAKYRPREKKKDKFSDLW